MSKTFLTGILVATLLFTGNGCTKIPNEYDYDDYYYDDYEDSTDSYDTYDESADSYDSYDSYESSVPQGSQSVYACNMDENYCENMQVEIYGDFVTYAYGAYSYTIMESYCDAEGCYFIDSLDSEWYFNF